MTSYIVSVQLVRLITCLPLTKIKLQSNVKYMLCDRCGTNVKVATAGSHNLKVHQAGKDCIGQAPIHQIAANFDMYRYFKKQPKQADSVPALAETQIRSPPAVTSTLNADILGDPSDADNTPIKGGRTPESTPVPADLPPGQTSDPVIISLRELRALSVHLPASVPEATSADAIACLGSDGAHYVACNGLTADTTEDWETYISCAAHGVTWLKDDVEVKGVIRRGKAGAEGFCSVLMYFIEKRSLDGRVLMPMIETLTRAVRSL